MRRITKIIGGMMGVLLLVFSSFVVGVDAQSIPTISPWVYYGGRTANIKTATSTTKVLIGAAATTTNSYLETPSFAVTGLLNKTCIGTDASGNVQEGTCGSGGGAWPFTTGLTNFGVAVQATTTSEWFQSGLHASSTSQFVYASTTAISGTTFCLIGDSCRTTWPTSGGGSGNVSTSSVPVAGQLAYWTTTTATPALLSTVATTTIGFSGPFSGASSLGYLVGGTNSTVTWTGLATTSQPASSNLLVSDGGSGVYGVATSTLTASSPLTGSLTQIGSGGSLGIQAASGSQHGYMSSTDWSLLHTATTTFTYPLIYTQGTNAVTFPATSTLYGTGTGGQVLMWSGSTPIWVATSTCAQITGSAALCDGDDATGAGGGAWPWTTATNFATSTNATTSPTWFKTGMIASSTSRFADALFYDGLTSNGTVNIANQLQFTGAWTQIQASTADTNLNFKTVAGTGDIVFTTNATDMMWLNDDGKVGVGTSTPYSKLTTWGTGSLFEAVTNSSSTVFSIGQNGATTTNFAISNITNSLLSTNANGSVVATTSIGVNYLTGILPVSKGGTGTSTNATLGNVLYWNGSNWAGYATSTLGLPLFSDLASYVPTSRTISTTYPMTGGGALSGNLTLALAFGTSTSNTWASTQDFSGATVKQHQYPSITWPGSATTTTATTTVPLGTAFVTEGWNYSECRTTSGSSGYRFGDGTNFMNYIVASTTEGMYALSSNNTFVAHERRVMEVGPLTAAQITCTVDKTINN